VQPFTKATKGLCSSCLEIALCSRLDIRLAYRCFGQHSH